MKVVIYDEGFIPGLGRGPFKTPIDISKDKFFLYKRMGLQIINAEKNIPIVETGIRNRIKKDNNEPKVSDIQFEQKKEIENVKQKVELAKEKAVELGIVPEDFFEEDKPEVEEISEINKVDDITPEVVDEPEVEEISEINTVDDITPEVVDEPEVEEISEIEETEIDLNTLTKKQLFELLTDAGVECNSNMNKATLLVLAEENL